MQTKFKKYLRFSFTALLLSAVGAGIFFTSCEDDEETDSGKAKLLSYGPMPIARGAELNFIGNNLDKVTSIVIPDGIEIEASEFTTHNTELITLTVPQNAEEGLVVIKTTEGEITTKTPIGYSEPISIDEFSPATIKPGEVITITGDYLNLVKEVIFTDRAVAADSTHFEEQSRKELKVTVPEEAQTGVIAVSDGAEEPVIVYSENELEVTLPSIEEITPNPVKAGNDITITGRDLNLVAQVRLGGDRTIDAEDFSSHAVEEIVLTIPDDTQDGPVLLIPASGVEVTSEAELEMTVPTIGSIEPITLKNGEQITVTGENLDLVSSVVFAEDAEGEIAEGRTATEIVVTTPETAISGEVVFNTLAEKSVTGEKVTFVDPSVTEISPNQTSPASSFTIIGENLDLVENVILGGKVEGEIENQTETELQVGVKFGSESGPLTLVAKNGSEVETSQTLTVEAPQFCYIEELPDEETEIYAGEVFPVEVANGSMLTDVVLNGNSSQYILDGFTLYFLIPSDASGETELTLVSSNESFTYTINVIGAAPVETVIMEETRDLGSWAGEDDGGAFRLNKSSFEGVKAGSILKFYFTASDYNQLQINDANWSEQEIIEITDPAQTTYEMELTQEFLDHILTTEDGWSETATIIQGEGLVIEKVSILTFDGAPENAGGETIWEGETVLGNWEGSIELGSDNFTNAETGMTLSISIKDQDPSADYWQIALKDSDWGDIEIADVAQDATEQEFAVDETLLNEMQNGGIIIQGAFCTITKIELK
ncbi:MAG: IPT/TIG domain-containing protein [Marinilabiliaceae bacterium]